MMAPTLSPRSLFFPDESSSNDSKFVALTKKLAAEVAEERERNRTLSNTIAKQCKRLRQLKQLRAENDALKATMSKYRGRYTTMLAAVRAAAAARRDRTSNPAPTTPPLEVMPMPMMDEDVDMCSDDVVLVPPPPPNKHGDPHEDDCGSDPPWARCDGATHLLAAAPQPPQPPPYSGATFSRAGRERMRERRQQRWDAAAPSLQGLRISSPPSTPLGSDAQSDGEGSPCF